MLNSLQACRAFACLFIVLHHTDGIFRQAKYFASRPFGSLFGCELVALNLLFALSGFIIVHAHRSDVGKPSRLAGYLYRRAHRIYPTYWIVLASMLAVYFLVPSFGDGSQRDVGVVLRSLFLWPQPSGDPVLVVSWTLCLEMLFYFAFGAFVIHPALGLLTFGSWAFVVWAKPFAQYPSNFLQNPYFIPIFAGMIACEAFHRGWIRRSRFVFASALATLAISQAANAFNSIDDFSIRLILLSIAGGLLLVSAANLERSGRLAIPSMFAKLGDASYSIYLVHYPALSILCKLAKAIGLESRIPHSALFAALAISAVGIGWGFFHVVERPLRRWGSLRKPKLATITPTEPIRQAA